MLWRARSFKYGRTCYSFSTGNSLLSWPPPCIVWRGKLSAKLNCITDHRSRGHCLPFARPKNQGHGLKVEGVPGFQLVIHCRGVPFSQKHCFKAFQEYLRIINMISCRMFPVNNSMNIQVTQSIGKRDLQTWTSQNWLFYYIIIYVHLSSNVLFDIYPQKDSTVCFTTTF